MNTILVPTDFSEVCDNAISHGISMAKSINSKITLVHAINKETKVELKKKKIGNEYIEEKLDNLATAFKKDYKGIEIDCVAKEGDIFSVITSTAKETDAVMIILGTHGKKGMQKFTGSYALKVVTTNSAPVIVVQKGSKQGTEYKNIVFPVSRSAKDRQKTNWAVHIAQIFNSTVHIFPKFESDDRFRRQMMPITKQIKNIFTDKDVKFVDAFSDSRSGDFSKQIAAYAKNKGADLIMIMTNPEGNALFGTTEEEVMFNEEQIPVLCVNTKQLTSVSWK